MATSTALPSSPSSCRALQRGPWQDMETPLAAPPAQPGASLPQDHVCFPSLPTTIQPSQGALVPLCSVFELLLGFFPTSKLQKYLIKGGFTFKPLHHVKVHTGEYLTPTTGYLLNMCSYYCDCSCTVRLSVCLTFLLEQVEKSKRNKLIRKISSLLSVFTLFSALQVKVRPFLFFFPE